MPSEEEARLLRQSAAAPVFVVTRLDTGLEGEPILFGRGLWASERVSFDLAERSTLAAAQAHKAGR